ncbi:hypothetical protein [Micromonospora aurantiaca (nom. illeg.)]|uniref:hypothetical protein n=2 Tax=Micromonospora aurantiaca (nom. illeg.) TaxID=47850 RepID=UPI0037B2B585
MAVVHVYHRPELAYQVKVTNQDGESLSRAAFTPDEVVRIGAAEVGLSDMTGGLSPRGRPLPAGSGKRGDDGRCAPSTSRTVATTSCVRFGESDMGMMVAARRIEAPADEVRYEFGFEDRFDRILVIDPQTLQARVEDGDLNAAASAITAKIVNAWRDRGDFPQRMLFAS